MLLDNQADTADDPLPTESSAFKKATSGHPYHFKGWVPAVSGRLSFRAFGQTSFPTNAVTANRSDGKTSYIVCYQKRDASDVVLPFKSVLSPLMLKLKGDFHFVCIAKTTHDGDRNQEFLEGWLVIFQDSETWKNHVLRIINELQGHIRKYRAYAHEVTLDEYSNRKFDATIKEILPMSSFNAAFSLSRSGTTSIAIPEKPIVSAKAPALPKDKFHRGHMMHVLSAQLFFFLRDIGHRHQHHDPKTDTISDLHRLNTVENDFTWRLNTLHSMYRKVIDLKRAPHSDTLANAMGVIAYATTFECICREELGKNKAKKLPIYYSTQTKDSISAAKSALELSYTEYVRKRDGRRGLLLSFLGAIFAFVALLSLAKDANNIEADPFLLYIAKIMLVYPFYSFGFVAFLYFIYGKMVVHGEPKAFPLFRKTLRLTHFMSRSTQIVLWFLMGALAILAFYWVWARSY